MHVPLYQSLCQTLFILVPPASNKGHVHQTCLSCISSSLPAKSESPTQTLLMQAFQQSSQMPQRLKKPSSPLPRSLCKLLGMRSLCFVLSLRGRHLFI